MAEHEPSLSERISARANEVYQVVHDFPREVDGLVEERVGEILGADDEVLLPLTYSELEELSRASMSFLGEYIYPHLKSNLDDLSPISLWVRRAQDCAKGTNHSLVALVLPNVHDMWGPVGRGFRGVQHRVQVRYHGEGSKRWGVNDVAPGNIYESSEALGALVDTPAVYAHLAKKT